MNWARGVNVSGQQLRHLRSTDNIVTITNTAYEINGMLQELKARNKKWALKLMGTKQR